MAVGVNGVNVGRDVSLAIVMPGIGLVDIDITTGFDAKPRYDRRRSKPLNGPPLSVPIPDGWEGTIDLDRTNAKVELLFAAQERQYYAGGGIQPGTISETIVNAEDGSVSVFIYRGVMLIFDDAGRKQADDVIKMKIAFEASTRTPLV